MEVFKPPCGVKDVISHIFMYDNLHNYLNYLEDNNKLAFSVIYDLTSKVNELMSLREDVKELNKSFDILNIRQDEMNNTLGYHSEKIMDLEVHESELKEVLNKTNYRKH